ncbi:MAG: YrdB family protein [Deinococcales bacterium]
MSNAIASQHAAAHAVRRADRPSMRRTEMLPTRPKVAPTAATGPAFEGQARPAGSPELTPLALLNIALRGLMEFGIVLAFGIWGYHAGSSIGTKLLLALGAPALGFGFWGAVDFRRAGRLAEPLRLVQELGLSGFAAAGLALAGHAPWGIALASLSLVHHALVYALGQRLIKRPTS